MLHPVITEKKTNNPLGFSFNPAYFTDYQIDKITLTHKVFIMSTRRPIKQIISQGVISFFILLWVYAATAKLLEFDQFKVQLSQVSFLKPMAGILVYIIPLVEYSLAGLLLVSKTRSMGLLGSALVMSVFTAYIAGMISFSPDLPCSCGGIINNFTWQQHLIFNLLFTALAITGVYYRSSTNPPHS
ncbi:MauE/DoxX family redox-associated membrane protein [Leeuwenhoekiella aestuarii]|uniref:MauE/DoxX family redox-associated membrane protein n=1 Tax=Leeuwenhoekiella aestuarii TaxID=2249426 RepID=UPI000FFF4C95|nr:MauE/DoxX family redox-associated membrane protein [Leeuwenhoekiella aestuarii]